MDLMVHFDGNRWEFGDSEEVPFHEGHYGFFADHVKALIMRYIDEDMQNGLALEAVAREQLGLYLSKAKQKV
jgi:hypothetical protein